MSPRRVSPGLSPAVDAALRRALLGFGEAVRDARRARGWSVAELATRAGISRALLYGLEAGQPCSTEARARIAVALGHRLEIGLVDPRRRVAAATNLGRDVVHSAMGEFEARYLRRFGFAVGMDEPYHHYQFAGRADVVAWDLERRALLHIENRTRFPDFQEMAGAYNGKRAYLAASIGERVGVARWASETHVLAALWSSEVLHALRIRTESFRSLCPDPTTAVDGWWSGEPPPHGRTSTLIVVDPVAVGRMRPCVGLDDALTVRPRHRGYADLAALLDKAA
jgi:transcriptional regulator with XRE-family HTH domain